MLAVLTGEKSKVTALQKQEGYSGKSFQAVIIIRRVRGD